MSVRDVIAAAAGSAGTSKTYIEDVFSTYLYTGNGSTQTINNGIDLAGKGGMIWVKKRNAASDHAIVSDNNFSKYLSSNLTGVGQSTAGGISFNSSGFTTDGWTEWNGSGSTYASWTFRKAPKFFDVVTYTGTGTTRSISHSLGQEPGMIIVKCTSYNSDWIVYHRSTGATSWLALNQTWASDNTTNYWNNTAPTSSVFTVRANELGVNASGQTYVAYLFAHDTTADGLIQCGSFTTDGSGNATVNLGWEPQYVMVKSTSSDDGMGWYVFDNMRGFTASGPSMYLKPHSSGSEAQSGTWKLTNTGFAPAMAAVTTYIYMAIRRGPMRTPTDGTKVFAIDTRHASLPTFTSNFPVDLATYKVKNSSFDWYWEPRLTNRFMYSNATTAEGASSLFGSTNDFQFNNGWGTSSTSNNTNVFSYMFQRAPGFFDVVCYTGTGSGLQTVNHNLGVAPELVILKARNGVDSWGVVKFPERIYGELNTTSPFYSSLSPLPTATQMTFAYDSLAYVNYLFASCPGVSKVGGYTGNGSSQTINCGFTNGARFVLIKKTSSTGDWYVWDTARGIVAATDPHLSLNTTAAEVTTDDTIDPDSTGFVVNQVTATSVNQSGVSYIYLAIA